MTILLRALFVQGRVFAGTTWQSVQGLRRDLLARLVARPLESQPSEALRLVSKRQYGQDEVEVPCCPGMKKHLQLTSRDLAAGHGLMQRFFRRLRYSAGTEAP